MTQDALLLKDLIELDVIVSTKEEIFKKIAHLLYKFGRVSDENLYYQALIDRENISTTGFGNGLAIPHAVINQVITPSICIFKLKSPVEWNSLDGKPVNLVIALAVPSKVKGTLHLKLLSKLSEELMEEEFVKKLKTAKTRDHIFQQITKIVKN